MNIVGIIPARMASTRFPGKPLAPISGVPMIGHVYFRSKMCSALEEVYIATEDESICDYAHSIHAPAVLTKNTHERASDRTCEAVSKIEKESGKQVDIAVMIQGDEPLVHPEMITAAVQAVVSDPAVQVANLMAPIKDEHELRDPNVIKVVVDGQGFALYFSRSPIPFHRSGKSFSPMKQVCIIPYRRNFLFKFNTLEATPLEVSESVDMMRVLEHGYRVKMVFNDTETHSVDVPADINHVEKLLDHDVLLKRYKSAKAEETLR